MTGREALGGRIVEAFARGAENVRSAFSRGMDKVGGWYAAAFAPTHRARDFRHEGNNATAVAAIGWGRRALSEAPMVLTVEGQQGREQVEGVELADLLEYPGQGQTSQQMAGSILEDLEWNGQTYILANARDFDQVVLQWRHSSTLEPITRDLALWEPIAEYRDSMDYSARNRGRNVRVYDAAHVGGLLEAGTIRVIHLILEQDPGDPRRGTSPLRRIPRELWTGDEIANYSATMLRNSGRINHILSPPAARANTDSIRMDPEDAERVRRRLDAAYTGERRGGSMVLTRPMDVKRLQYSPDEMALPMLRAFTETSITGALGVPGILAGTHSWLERNTLANYHVARISGYEDFLFPVSALIARQMTVQLVPLFYEDPRTAGRPRIEFDWSGTRILEQQRQAQAQMWRELGAAGNATVEEVRERTGLDARMPDGQLVYVPGLSELQTTPLEASDGLEETPAGGQDPQDPDSQTEDGEGDGREAGPAADGDEESAGAVNGRSHARL